jgi:hypothetical protein
MLPQAFSVLTTNLESKRIAHLLLVGEEVGVLFLMFHAKPLLSSVVPLGGEGPRGDTTKDLIVVCSGYNLPARGPLFFSVAGSKCTSIMQSSAPAPAPAPEKPQPSQANNARMGIDRDLIQQKKTKITRAQSTQKSKCRELI